jgi:hypothetical protein
MIELIMTGEINFQPRITVDQYNTVHDKWTMCKDENKQLYKIIKALEKQIKKLEK